MDDFLQTPDSRIDEVSEKNREQEEDQRTARGVEKAQAEGEQQAVSRMREVRESRIVKTYPGQRAAR